eukprot:GFUD01034679.1.p1 GENE.GFUD01034679.1~~GFUD01034679.1.p1  ORF type:complete len:410 (-),score=139.65 GFUD01034679.1:35-1264(-)
MKLGNVFKWRTFLCAKSSLRLDITLKCGQSFRWKLHQPQSFSCSTPVYVGVLQKRLFLVTQDDSHILYHCVSHPDSEDIEEYLKNYFQLKIDLPSLYSQWAKNDPIFDKISRDYPGVRMLRQDPLENVFSFICSANNNIARISGMVEKMCVEYGELVTEFESVKYYSFPSLESLSKVGVEEKLRELGFGYRAKYIQQSAAFILAQGGEAWLHNHRDMQYKEARQSLLQLAGVGPKVADCVLLMSMDQTGAVPVDIHMFNIAKQYLPHLEQHKTVTDKVYLEIGNHFRSLYGDYAGWAHSVLFSADLKHLRELKTEDKTGIVKVKMEQNGKIKVEKEQNVKIKSEKKEKEKSDQVKSKPKVDKWTVRKTEKDIKTEKVEITEFFKTVKPTTKKRKNSSMTPQVPIKMEKF